VACSDDKWIVALTGASGMKYARRLLCVLSRTVSEVHVVVSEAALRVLKEEENIKSSQSSLSAEVLTGEERDNIFFYNPRDIGARVASGSALFSGMIVIPCTMGTLAAIASGTCANLIHRAADVTLKENRKLILVPRETPLSVIHLENMVKLARLGVTMFPAMPGFYHQPKSIDEMVDLLVMKVLDHMGIRSELVTRWGEQASEPRTPVLTPVRRSGQREVA